MKHNASLIREVLCAAHAAGCEIVHVSKLAGQAPFVASRPCLGDGPAPLLPVTQDEYLTFMAELRSRVIVETSQTLSCRITTAGGQYPELAEHRTQLNPFYLIGRLRDARVAVYYLLDSAGQETTILYVGLGSARDIEAYWSNRSAVCRTFSERYDATDEDLYALCRELDRTVDAGSVDVAAFAHRRGLSLARSAAPADAERL